MYKKINEWLMNPKRNYDSGLALFNAMARPNMRTNYASYLNEIDELDKKPFSAQFNLLTNQMAQIARQYKSNPEAFSEQLAKQKPEVVNQEDIVNIRQVKESVRNLKEQKQTIAVERERLEELPSLIASKQAEIDSTKEDIDAQLSALDLEKTKEKPNKANLHKMEKNLIDSKSVLEELETDKKTLETEVSVLMESPSDEGRLTKIELAISKQNANYEDMKVKLEAKGLKIITEDDLPEAVKSKKERISIIVPLMAKIHAELSDENLTDDQRKDKAEELCKLDDERRGNWDAIDGYLETGEEILDEEDQEEYSTDDVIRGTQIAARMERLKENIKRSEESAEKFVDSKPNLAASAERRAEKYKAELAELEAELDK